MIGTPNNRLKFNNLSVPRILFYLIIYLSPNPTIIELLSFSVCLGRTLCGDNAHSPYGIP